MKSIENQFWKYVIPSMITVLLGGTFAFVDGIFIGQGTGDIGLTAVNLVAPIAALVTALAAGIGMGGSIVMSTYAGNKDEENMKKARGCTLLFLIIISTILFLVGSLFSKQIVSLLGAKGKVFDFALDYLKIVLTFGCFQMLSSGLSNLVINSGKSVLAMIVMVGALILNIILDGVFVLGFNMGTLGAALATVIGQGASAIVYIIILISDKKTRPTVGDLKLEKSIAKKVIKTGISPLGIQLAPSIVVMCINYACVWTNGSETLATFAVMNQLILAIQILFTGIGNGIQPIISYCTGADNQAAVYRTLKKAMIFMIYISIGLIVSIYVTRFNIPAMFNASSQVGNMVQKVLGYLLIMIPFIGFNRVIVPFLFASSRSKEANILTYIEPLIITPVSLLICCLILSSYGIWLAMLLSQISLFLIGYVVIKKTKLEYKINVDLVK